MLKQRVTTALLLLPILAALFFLMPLEYFAVAVGVIVLLVASEWAQIIGFKSLPSRLAFMLSVSMINGGLWLSSRQLVFWPSLSWPAKFAWDWPIISLILGVTAILVAVAVVLGFSKMPKWWANKWVSGLLGLLLLPALFVALISIRNESYFTDVYRGGMLVMFMFLLIWAADTGAYFSGKAFGKTKLAPVISPNKTWEGVVGGLFLSVSLGWAGAYWLKLDVDNGVLYTLILFALAGLSVIGDLFESALKRVAKVKDSGTLLPGHGGLFDRLDSTIVVAPAFYLSFTYLGWF